MCGEGPRFTTFRTSGVSADTSIVAGAMAKSLSVTVADAAAPDPLAAVVEAAAELLFVADVRAHSPTTARIPNATNRSR
jgi:hypothetical protein